ncbi:MAG: bifunctional (p)ppGpp synthetase/guanosine-3',5'-bis(diphosphate) 3'-pyrophosphohydrolase [Pseudomonadota bacterium]|nr:bifunctional (p)ppGpp synthetase/guanosine-3',5'-bis(diphosphate) 3'-pyrophosphohydrolase [Pseudomonadota bacterium]
MSLMLDEVLALPAASVLSDADRQRLERSLPALPQGADWPWLADTLALLATLGADARMLAAAIVDAAGLAPDVLKTLPLEAGEAALLEGLAAEQQVRALHAEQRQGSDPEGLRRLLLAMSQDLRVVPILLARHLARLRHAVAESGEEASALARLTRDIHAPLANRLGIWQLKWELEDLAFRVLEPDAYRRIARLLDDKRRDREDYIAQFKRELGEAVAAAGIQADVAGRPKHIYSIWRKMQKKNLPFEGLYDLRAVRVLVDETAECYTVLGLVHARWLPVPGEFDDYIARPKANDYRSLHTCVVGPGGKVVEVQIRTREMHAHAELGVAAHWRYKEGGAGDAALERKVAWMRKLLDASSEEGGADLQAGLDHELVEDRIYALSPKGEVIDLPQGATPLDFAYRVHTEVGHRCRGAKVDGRIVTLDYKLRTGERVEIMTGKVSEPRRDWLLPGNRFLASARSRDKVRAWFHKLDRERNQQAGREILERELKRLGQADAVLDGILPRFHASSIEALWIQLALGETSPTQVIRALSDAHKTEQAAQAGSRQVAAISPHKAPDDNAVRPGVSVAGVDNLLVHIARCCQPVPGEPVAGYLSKRRGLAMHRANCPALQRMVAADPARWMPVSWEDAGAKQTVEIAMTAIDRRYLLRDVSNLIAQENLHVGNIHGNSNARDGRIRLTINVQVRDFDQLSQLIGKLAALPGVEDVRRN